MIELRAGNDSVQLQGPEFGDKMIVVGKANLKRARDATPYSFKIVPSGKRILNYEFIGLDRTIILTLFDFLKVHKNKDIILTDPVGQPWIGRITNQPFQSTHAQRQGSTFSLTFEGERLA